MSSTRIHIIVPDALLARIDGAKGDGVSRGHFVRRAVEAALNGPSQTPQGVPEPAGGSVASRKPAASPRASAVEGTPIPKIAKWKR